MILFEGALGLNQHMSLKQLQLSRDSQICRTADGPVRFKFTKIHNISRHIERGKEVQLMSFSF